MVAEETSAVSMEGQIEIPRSERDLDIAIAPTAVPTIIELDELEVLRAEKDILKSEVAALEAKRGALAPVLAEATAEARGQTGGWAHAEAWVQAKVGKGKEAHALAEARKERPKLRFLSKWGFSAAAAAVAAGLLFGILAGKNSMRA